MLQSDVIGKGGRRLEGVVGDVGAAGDGTPASGGVAGEMQAAGSGKGHTFEGRTVRYSGLHKVTIYAQDCWVAINPEFPVNLLDNYPGKDIFSDSDGDGSGVFINFYKKTVGNIQCVIAAGNIKLFFDG